jgi:uncharacterized protein YcgL (UPF0745 family)
MNPRQFINQLRSPSGILVLFLIGLTIVLIMINSRRGPESGLGSRSVLPTPVSGQQLKQTIERDMSPFNPPRENDQPERDVATAPVKRTESAPVLPPISLFAETPSAEPPPKKISSQFAPYGRLVPCELVITVDSSSIDTPIVGLVTEDVYHHGQLIIPAGTEVHGKAQVDHSRERIASDGRWTLVWQTGQELSVSGVALDRDATTDVGSWDITDGSAGLRGRVIKSDDMAEIKLYVAALLSGAAGAFTQTQSTPYGSFALPSLQNAPLAGAQSVLQSYAQQVQQTIERDGFYVRVPAGKQFYLYITQTIDEADAKIGGSLAQEVPSPERVSKPVNVDSLPPEPASVPATMAPLRTYPSAFTQNYHNP